MNPLMSRLGPAWLALFLVASSASGAERVVNLKTRDGRVLSGRVLQETSRGYLFRTDQKTELIDYANVDDLSSADQPPPAPSAMPPGEAMPPPPPPLTATQSENSEVLPETSVAVAVT